MRMNRKLKSRGGFTLAETLLAVLILLLVSSIVAGGIPVAKNAYEKVVLGSNAQLLLSTAVSALRDEIGTARQVTVEGDAVTYISGDTGAMSKLSPGAYKGKSTILLQEYVKVSGLNAETGTAEGAERPLVSNAAVTADLYVTYDVAEISGDVVRFLDLRVCRAGGGLIARLGGDGTLSIRPVSIGDEEE